MLSGFEDYTVELTTEEKEFARYLARALEHRIGKKKAVTSTRMSKALLDQYQIQVSGARIRKIVQYIRLNKMTRGCLLANSKGYYIETNKKAVRDYLESLQQRIMAINAMSKALEETLDGINGMAMICSGKIMTNQNKYYD